MSRWWIARLTRSGAAVLFILLAASCSTGPPAPPGAPTTPPVSAASPTPTTPSASPSDPGMSPTPIPLPSFAQLSAPSRDVVWVVVAGNHLFRSTDRGETWQRRALPPSTVNTVVNADVSFVDDQEGWASTAGQPATGCTSQTIEIWRTRDGGTAWERLTANGIGTFQCKSGLSFADSRRGFLVASSRDNAPVVYRTTDGGRTWSASRPLADPPGFTTAGGRSLRPGRVRAFGSTLLLPAYGDSGGRLDTYIFRSADGGISWSYLATVPNPDGALALVTASRWLHIVPPDRSAESTDGGATWHPYATDYSQAAPIAPEIVFGDPDVGYATVRGSLQRTLDGGAHWTPLRTPGTT